MYPQAVIRFVTQPEQLILIQIKSTASKIYMFTKSYESTQDYFISYRHFLYDVLTIRILDMKQEKKKLNLIICTSQLY